MREKGEEKIMRVQLRTCDRHKMRVRSDVGGQKLSFLDG